MPRILLLFAALMMVVAAACGDDDDNDVEPTPGANGYDVSNQPDDAAAIFVTPGDGDTVSAPVAVEMRAEGVSIVPAGAPAVGEGHFHILVDVDCVDEGEVLPGPSEEATADGYRHFGDGSTEAQLDLEPGTYDLCLQLADGTHIAYGDTDTITITVE